MTFRLAIPDTETSEYFPLGVIPVVLLLFAWHLILKEHSKQPLPRKLMTALIAYTVFATAMLPLGLLSVAFYFTFDLLVLPLLLNVNTLCAYLQGQRCSAYTEATITDIRRVRQESKYGVVSYWNYPTVTFDVNGESYSVELHVPCEPDEIGNTRWIKYNPSDPQDITQEEYEKGLDKLFFGIGVLLLCAALISFIIGIVNIVSLL
ncbi:MAG: hypothetical protein IJW99_02670 [Clostridia bacterium]|nr:hypothetical protein [Clostridia bacterium]